MHEGKLGVTCTSLQLQPQMVKGIENLHSYIIEGKSECHVFEAVPSCSGGKVFKNCHHQVGYIIYCDMFSGNTGTPYTPFGNYTMSTMHTSLRVSWQEVA
jgi:hypothetical protein